MLFIGIGLFSLAVALNTRRSHTVAFRGKCQLCHEEIPSEGTPFEQVVLKDTPERLCANCHEMEAMTSHPVGVVPSISRGFFNCDAVSSA